MSFLKSLLLASLLGMAAARPHDCKAASSSAAPKALYFISNAASNAVVAIPIAADGLLAGGVLTKTGGKGSASVDADGKAAAPDALVSQSSLTLAGNTLFAVDAGSNTLSMLSIDASNASALTPVSNVAVPGTFPNTVAASSKHKLVCVGTTGADAGISCTSFSGAGLNKMDALRTFALNQTTPPVGPLNTVSQVFFSEDENTLFATVKGDPTVNNTGFLASFDVEEACGHNSHTASLSRQAITSSPAGTAVLFGSVALPNSRIFATDASFGAAVLSVNDAGHGSLVAKQAVEGQAATCWATVSERTGTAFVTDVGVPRLVEMSVKDASIVKELDLAGTGVGGLIDLKAAGDFIYALAPGNGTGEAQVLVVDVKGGKGQAKLAQCFGLGKLGAGKTSQGMAVLV